MEYTVNKDLTEFEFWSGAKEHNFTYSELKELTYVVEELYSDTLPTETEINDLFWFEEETLCEWLGMDFEEEYLNRD
jgi:hypothetical protein